MINIRRGTYFRSKEVRTSIGFLHRYFARRSANITQSLHFTLDNTLDTRCLELKVSSFNYNFLQCSGSFNFSFGSYLDPRIRNRYPGDQLITDP
jgi:hypothetical protein